MKQDVNGYCNICHGMEASKCPEYNSTSKMSLYLHGVIADGVSLTSRLFAEDTPHHRQVLQEKGERISDMFKDWFGAKVGDV